MMLPRMCAIERFGYISSTYGRSIDHTLCGVELYGSMDLRIITVSANIYLKFTFTNLCMSKETALVTATQQEDKRVSFNDSPL